jgi:hypothetical protein
LGLPTSSLEKSHRGERTNANWDVNQNTEFGMSSSSFFIFHCFIIFYLYSVAVAAHTQSYWILFVMCGTLWSIIYVIMVFLTDYIFEKWEYSNVYAGQIAGIVWMLFLVVCLSVCIDFLGFHFLFFTHEVFVVAMLTSVVSGLFVSHVGKVLTMLMLGGLLFTISCLILSLTTFSPFIGVVGIGTVRVNFSISVSFVLSCRIGDGAFRTNCIFFYCSSSSY